MSTLLTRTLLCKVAMFLDKIMIEKGVRGEDTLYLAILVDREIGESVCVDDL